MDTEILWRVAVVQLAAVAIVALALGLALPSGFFERFGWLTGPAAWLGCAWFTARFVGLPVGPVLARAVAAGAVSLLFLLLGMHWLGAAVAVCVLAALCSVLPRPSLGTER